MAVGKQGLCAQRNVELFDSTEPVSAESFAGFTGFVVFEVAALVQAQLKSLDVVLKGKDPGVFARGGLAGYAVPFNGRTDGSDGARREAAATAPRYRTTETCSRLVVFAITESALAAGVASPPKTVGGGSGWVHLGDGAVVVVLSRPNGCGRSIVVVVDGGMVDTIGVVSWV